MVHPQTLLKVLRFYLIDQQKVVHNWEVEGKKYTLLKNKQFQTVVGDCIQPPLML